MGAAPLLSLSLMILMLVPGPVGASFRAADEGFVPERAIVGEIESDLNTSDLPRALAPHGSNH
jgi:hypothetical protein